MARLKWRTPGPGEPHRSAPIYVTLGMTKGAMIAFAIIYALAVAGFFRVESIARDQKETIKSNQKVLVAVARQQQENKNALKEVCRQTETIYALAQATTQLFQFQISHRTIDPRAIPIYTKALQVFSGYAQILRERPACQEVLNP